MKSGPQSGAAKAQKILFVSCNPTHPVHAGSRIRMLTVAQALRDAGWETYLLYQDLTWGDVPAMRQWWGRDNFRFVSYSRHNPGRRVAQYLCAHSQILTRGLDALRAREAKRKPKQALRRDISTIDELVDPGLKAPLQAWCREHQFQVVVAEYAYLSQVLTWVPSGTKRVIDTIDVMALAKPEEERRKYWLGVTAEEECRGLDRADVLWAIQDHEAEVFRRCSRARIATIGHLVGKVSAPAVHGADRSGILFVGSRHAHNVDGLRAFGRRIWPQLDAETRTTTLTVVGDIAEVVSAELPFRFLGPVDELAPHYAKAHIVIAPIYGGTGLKVKVIEAMAHGCPVVTTPEGAWGLEPAEGHGLVIARNDKEFANAVRQFLLDPGLARSAGEMARQFAVDWNHRQKKALIESLAPLNGARPAP